MFRFQLQEILEGPRGDPGNPLSMKGQGLFFWVLCHSLSANDKCGCMCAHLSSWVMPDPRWSYALTEGFQESWGLLTKEDTHYIH